jgi:hypothetical protein
MKTVKIKSHFNIRDNPWNIYNGSPSVAKCNKVRKMSQENITDVVRYSALLNIPFANKLLQNDPKQIVLGNTKYLLPYYICNDLFDAFAFKPEKWSEELNAILMHCLVRETDDNSNIVIRLVTTPKDIYDKDNNIRITGKEIAVILNKYALKIVKLKSEETDNIYFIIPENIPSGKFYKNISANSIIII